MPIYAFECTACGHQFDRLQKLSDADPSECPACGKASLRRQMTAPSFRLAGSGWYETDFKGDKDTKRNLAGDGKDAAKPEKSDSAAKTDAPASKSGGDATAAKPAATPASPTPSKPSGASDKP